MNSPELVGKLVRDGIPALLQRDGVGGTVHQVAGAQLDARLRAKLTEEVSEFLASGEVVELADIIEVCVALAEQARVAEHQLFAVRAAKRAERGGFTQGWVWEPPTT